MMTEDTFYFALMQDLSAAKQSGNAEAIRDALDELDVFTLRADPSPVRAKAAQEVERHGFHRVA